MECYGSLKSQRCHGGALQVAAMTVPILTIAIFCIVATSIHIASVTIVIVRFRRSAHQATAPIQRPLPPVTLVRPLCGIDNYAAETLRSTFEIDYPDCQILFCVASAKDPIVPLVERLIAEHPGVDARLLLGNERVNNNPKLNNILKGWRAARHDWIVFADSNVLMPRDYIQRLFASWRADTGLVASPPAGCRPEGIWAELECTFLNTYQARWQYLIDSLGRGFAQGKTMLWRRTDLERAGGIEALGNEVAEDAAATKIVRSAGLKVRLVNRPLAQPLGRRSATEVWSRQVRWARLRRASFFLYFLPEILSGGVLPMIAAAIVASAVGLPATLCAGLLGVVWYGGEMLLAAAAEWHLPALYPLYGLARDLLLPVLFIDALRSSDFVWRGNAMQVEHIEPARMMARVRPRLQEVAAGSRRRLRALRSRMS
jgi:ceramide glucosyltransferase